MLASSRSALLLALAVGLTELGCSFLGLDDLSAGTGGEAAAASSASSSTAEATASSSASVTATSAAQAVASTVSTGAAGDGGAGGEGQGGEGGELEVCAGCLDELGACQAGDTVEVCGIGEAACVACEVSSACQAVSCVDGACLVENVAADTPCDAGAGIGSGACDADGVCNAVPENCANGEDDDANGLVDCADPACEAFTCFPEAPPLWFGPFHVYQGSSLSCPVAAGELGLPLLGTGFVTDPVACQGCDCTTSCSAQLDYAFGGSATCGNLNQDATLAPEECTTIGAQGQVLRYLFRASPGEGTCESSSFGGVDVPTVVFAERLTSCAPTVAGGGCDVALTCVPRPPDVSGIVARTCIAREGDRTCPAEFPVEQRAGEDIADGRSCTPCSCGEVTCAGKVTLSNTPDCRCPECRDAPLDAGGCAEITTKDLTAVYQADGTCKNFGGEPQGEVDYANDYTICCLD